MLRSVRESKDVHSRVWRGRGLARKQCVSDNRPAVEGSHLEGDIAAGQPSKLLHAGRQEGCDGLDLLWTQRLARRYLVLKPSFPTTTRLTHSAHIR